MATQTTIKVFYMVNGSLTDPDSVVLSDPTGTFGLIRTDTGTSVVALNTAFTRVQQGVFSLTFDDPAPSLEYDYWIKAVIAGTPRFEHRPPTQISTPVFTLSQVAPSVDAARADAGTVSIFRGDSFSRQLTGLGNVTSRTKLFFTVKADPQTQTDSQSQIQIEESAGLTVLAGQAYSTHTDGSITVNDQSAGSVTIALSATATSQLTPGIYTYDVQSTIAGAVTTRTMGTLVVCADVTRTVA
jgi:hypothetical protein